MSYLHFPVNVTLKLFVFDEERKQYICEKPSKMTKEELLEMIVSWENLPHLILAITSHPEKILMLSEIAFNSNHPKSWRAAWIMDKIHEKAPELIIPLIPQMIRQIKTEQDEGKKRHFLKLISMGNISPEEQGFMFDYCLKIFLSGKEPLAVRVHAMQILFNISETEFALKPEVLAIIEHEMEYDSSPGIISRGKKLAKKLGEQIQIKG